MTRIEQIEKQAALLRHEMVFGDLDISRDILVEMALWADANPNYHDPKAMHSTIINQGEEILVLKQKLQLAIEALQHYSDPKMFYDGGYGYTDESRAQTALEKIK